MRKLAKKITKNVTKKITAAVLTMALVFTSGAISVTAAPSVPSKVTYYMDSKSGETYVNTGIYDDYSSESQSTISIEPSTVKSSNQSVIEVTYVSNGEGTDMYYDLQDEGVSYESTYTSSSLGLLLKKKGTSNISFKIGSSSYKVKATVKAYTNPVKTLKITGINNGKNIAGKFKSENFASGYFSKNVKNAKITVKAAKGWKVSNIYVYGDSAYISKSYNEPKSKVSYGIGELNANAPDDGYTITVEMVNTKDGGTITLTYSLNNNL